MDILNNFAIKLNISINIMSKLKMVFLAGVNLMQIR